ncbi:uncharacterized protein DUF2793 [Shimia isoporae]|uniref:Uncharacterized protein DUF2793 n=1 Tax=Shimia isoporae TaxID=647720 RepID=A0A4R1N373_9RHOB|nr:DUF2793 domain-containing protein [Shimia isoporae]TCK99873.1 uncharacterized protein DUF2793 [Shimia isoporae]
MSDLSPNLDMPFLYPAQAQKHVTHNEALQVLDAVVQLSVAAFNITTPPSAPQAGSTFALGAGASGVWAGQDGMLAHWDGTGWLYVAPKQGWRAWGRAEGELRVFDGSQWLVPSIAELGVNTSADATNRFSVAAEASLLSHEGAGHQLKLNKNSTSDTASLLFQTNWTGHAEMGLAGEDNWSVKVSADGVGWTEALKIDSTSGLVSGAAVQTSANDATPGRLMRADFGYSPANLVAPVIEIGGVPNGGVIERGSNANGEFVRYADGTAEGWASLTLVYANAAKLAETWTYPIALVSGVVVSSAILNVSGLSTSATPSTSDLCSVCAGTISVSSCNFQLFRMTGARNFEAADTAQVRVRVIGRWF